MLPQAIDERCRQLRLFTFRHQSCERRSAVRFRAGVNRLTMKLWKRNAHDTVLRLIEHGSAGSSRHQFRVRIASLSRLRIDGLSRHAGRLTEEAMQLPKSRLLRLAERVVVALVALQLLTQKH